MIVSLWHYDILNVVYYFSLVVTNVLIGQFIFGNSLNCSLLFNIYFKL